uniref:non-specific serine/threonine protein kinase n=1 Tax=Lygus hesperus TaxID=30085 RepID=A0A0A9WG74_LYGHE
MLTLNHAFGGTDMHSLVQKILKGTYPPIDSSYSSHLSCLVSKMLQNDPHLRPNASQIISLPFIHDALANLQRGIQAAKQGNNPVALPAMKQSVDVVRKSEE